MEGRNRLRKLAELMSDMERMRRLGRSGYDTNSYDESEHRPANAWVPAADVAAVGDDLVIWIELPGIARDEIDLSYAGSAVTVSGERLRPHQDAVTFLHRDRYYGTFRWSMALPETVSEQHISASYDDGLLTLTVKGACADTPAAGRKIPIG